VSVRPYENVVFVAFGNSPEWDFAGFRLKRVLKKFFPYAKRFIVDQNWLFETSLYRENKKFFHKNRRGFGLWTWKPLLIKEALALHQKCDYVVYFDMGCDLNINALSLEKINEYLNLTKLRDGFAFELPLKEVDWTAKSVLEHFSATQSSKNQVSASVLFLRNTKRINSFLGEWLSSMSERDFLLTIGKTEGSSQEASNHRHDQSILSLLWHRENLYTLPDETHWIMPRIFDSSKPIWVSRNREFFTVNSSSTLRQLSRVIRKFVVYLRLKLRIKLQ